MRVVQINSTCGIGSTGKIAVSISDLLSLNNIDNEILYSVSGNDCCKGISCGNSKNIKLQALKSRLLGNYGFNSKKETKRIIDEINASSPDIVLIHNIHGHDCNLRMLFSYFKENKIKLFWVFHDCWAFTGYCTHFTFVKCDKWKKECRNCPQRKQYSWFLDRSSYLYQQKKILFSNLDLTIITPSQWLADLVKQSFLKNYPIQVINNGIDLQVFKPISSNFRQKYNISEDKYILLGVAFDWGMRKGLDVFIELSKRLDKNKFQIVLVGTDDSIDKMLPNSIISIHRTRDQNELAEMYSAADLFVNPTREENYPTVNMESIACGTPVLTFRTGGSPEILDEKTGYIVDCDDIDEMERQIIRICKENVISIDDCVAKAKLFDKDLRFKEYIDLLLGEKR